MTKILTIDSDEAVVKRIVKILESNNYQAQSATTWTEAVDAIANGQPDLVLLNLEMPIIHVDVLLEFIREEGFEMPVIAVSFPVEDAVAKVLREHGVFSIVEKPFEDESLIEEIERVIAIAEFAEEIESDTSADAEETEASEEPSDTTDAEEPSSDSTSESASDDDEDKSAIFLKQPRDLRTAPRPKMSKRKKVILFSIIGFYVLIGGFIIAMYITDEVPAFVDQILRNW